jgi:hypothetical protein
MAIAADLLRLKNLDRSHQCMMKQAARHLPEPLDKKRGAACPPHTRLFAAHVALTSTGNSYCTTPRTLPAIVIQRESFAFTRAVALLNETTVSKAGRRVFG